jgi:hypothetical protein
MSNTFKSSQFSKLRVDAFCLQIFPTSTSNLYNNKKSSLNLSKNNLFSKKKKI